MEDQRREDENEEASTDEGRQHWELAAKTGAQVGGGLMMLFPELLVPGVITAASADLFATATGRHHYALKELKARIWERFTGGLHGKLKDENLEEKVPDLQNILIQAAPFVMDAETEEKRRLIENIILNTARSAEVASVEAEAFQAMQWISEMSPVSVRVFAIIARRYQGQTDTTYAPAFEVSVEWGLRLAGAAMAGVVAQSAVQALAKLPSGPLVRKANDAVHWIPTNAGLWLGNWIAEHPAKPKG